MQTFNGNTKRGDLSNSMFSTSGARNARPYDKIRFSAKAILPNTQLLANLHPMKSRTYIRAPIFTGVKWHEINVLQALARPISESRSRLDPSQYTLDGHCQKQRQKFVIDDANRTSGRTHRIAVNEEARPRVSSLEALRVPSFPQGICGMHTSISLARRQTDPNACKQQVIDWRRSFQNLDDIVGAG